MYLSLQRLCQVHNPDRQAMQQPCNRSPQPMTQQARGSQMYVVARASHPMKENSATCTSRPGCGPEGMQPLTHPSHPPHCRCCHQPRTHWQQQNRHGAQVQPFDTGSHKQPLGGPRLCLLSKLLLQTHQHMPFAPRRSHRADHRGRCLTLPCAPHMHQLPLLLQCSRSPHLQLIWAVLLTCAAVPEEPYCQLLHCTPKNSRCVHPVTHLGMPSQGRCLGVC
jgi:hypothetical protein